MNNDAQISMIEHKKDSGPREQIQLQESETPSGKRTCKKSIISFKQNCNIYASEKSKDV